MFKKFFLSLCENDGDRDYITKSINREVLLTCAGLLVNFISITCYYIHSDKNLMDFFYEICIIHIIIGVAIYMFYRASDPPVERG